MAAKTKTQPTPANGNKPVMTLRANGVKVSIWENLATNADGERRYHKCVLQRVYKDGEEFKTTSSLSSSDILVAKELLAKAWEWITQAESNKNGEEQEIPT